MRFPLNSLAIFLIGVVCFSATSEASSRESFIVQAQSAAPSATPTGRMYFDTDDLAPKIYTGTAWEQPVIPYYVNAYFSTGALPLGAADTVYSTISDSALTIIDISPYSLAAWVPCDGGNSPTGTTCAAGNEELGISFVSPRLGTIKACWSVMVDKPATAGDDVDIRFFLSETSLGSSTSEEPGVTVAWDSTTGSTTYCSMQETISQCDYFRVSSGRVVLRLFRRVVTAVGVTPTITRFYINIRPVSE